MLLAAFAAFSTYFCMYGYRKAIGAATYDGLSAFGISFKSALIIFQVLGYMSAKFIGISFIASLKNENRVLYILLLISMAHLSLLLLALLPSPYNVLLLFLNGLGLGLIWGLVFSFIEGRRQTDFIALILSINFIFSSGVIKTIGLYLIYNLNIPEIYMPFAVGCIFFPVLLFSLLLLNKVPPPTDEEKKERGIRIPVNAHQRMELFRLFMPGLIFIIFINLLLTILREIKDNYSVEIIQALRPNSAPAIFTKMESLSALVVLIFLISLSGLRNHIRSLLWQHLVIISGFLTISICTVMLYFGKGDPISLLVLFTIGLYLSYNTLQCLFFERFVAAFKVRGNTGFFFYLMDSIAYLGSCFLILNKELNHSTTDWLTYFIGLGILFGILGTLITLFSWNYFNNKYAAQNT